MEERLIDKVRTERLNSTRHNNLDKYYFFVPGA